jgi:hypothetical protein
MCAVQKDNEISRSWSANSPPKLGEQEESLKSNDSRISDPEIPKSQVGRQRAEKNGSTFSRIVAYGPSNLRFRDLRRCE